MIFRAPQVGSVASAVPCPRDLRTLQLTAAPLRISTVIDSTIIGTRLKPRAGHPWAAASGPRTEAPPGGPEDVAPVPVLEVRLERASPPALRVPLLELNFTHHQLVNQRKKT